MDNVGFMTSLSESGDKNIGSEGNATTFINCPDFPLFSSLAIAYVAFSYSNWTVGLVLSTVKYSLFVTLAASVGLPALSVAVIDRVTTPS